jgi:predicted CXXCH cytochrome family protein
VLPIFKQHCLECHGAPKAMNSFRLDRRRDALCGGTISDVAPGNSAVHHVQSQTLVLKQNVFKQ